MISLYKEDLEEARQGRAELRFEKNRAQRADDADQADLVTKAGLETLESWVRALQGVSHSFKRTTLRHR